MAHVILEKMKKETIKKKPDIKVYKRIAREMYPILPTKVHRDRSKYDRKREKARWKKEVKEEI